MGYTHYYYQKKNFTQKQWERICIDFIDIIYLCNDKNILLAYEYDSPVEPQEIDPFGNTKMLPKCPEVSDNRIRFNGWKDQGHETFILNKKMPAPHAVGKEYFSFCKTAHKPYDLAVGLLLLSAKNRAPKAITVCSDGDWDNDWGEIRKEYKKLFNKDPECPFVTENT